MIRSLTIIENKDETGNTTFNLSGDLPLDECARALVVIAFNSGRPAPVPAEVVPCKPE